MAEDWQSLYPPIQSDHKAVTVKIAQIDAPHLGKGRWAIPQRLFNNRPFLRDIESKGKEALETAKEIKSRPHERTETKNAQKLWEDWKSSVIKSAKDRAKKKTSYLNKLGIATEQEIKNLNNDDSNESPGKSQAVTDLEQRRRKIEAEKTLTGKQQSNAQYRLEGKTVSNYWIRLNKAAKPRDTFRKLRKPGSCNDPNIKPHETCSELMAELAKHHHDNLQMADLTPNETQESRTQELESISTIPLPHLSNQHKNELAKKISLEEVGATLSSTANRKAASLDGIMYEIYKNLKNRHCNLLKEGRNGFDITEMLALVYNDIAEKGLCENSDMNAGWMCPIYKKNDKCNIANYCPITVLNTDYKLMAKKSFRQNSQPLPLNSSTRTKPVL
jgi:hypothetical protein